ncbi:MAG: DUF2283 domain-containing protein [Ignavibacteriaceae bacterium]
MTLSYDPLYNIAYIRFKENIEKVETLKLSDDVNIDISPDGKVYGIEFLNANNQLDLINLHKINLVNNATGEKEEISFNIKN